jgi:hypothetical protein
MRSLIPWRDKNSLLQKAKTFPSRSSMRTTACRKRATRPPQAHTKGAFALAFLASMWAIGLGTSADAALHPTMTGTPAEGRRKAREIAPPYIAEWVVPDWYRSKLSLTAGLLCGVRRAPIGHPCVGDNRT